MYIIKMLAALRGGGNMQIEIKVLNKEFYTDPVPKVCDSPKLTPYTGYKNLPSYATPGSAAMDLRCTKDVTIYPQERVMIPTGLAIWVGSGVEEWVSKDDRDFWSVAGLILPKSGQAHKKGLILGNSVGLIDEDYNKELLVSALNDSTTNIKILAGERFCQLLFIPVIKVDWLVVENFSGETERTGGFGSTGVI